AFFLIEIIAAVPERPAEEQRPECTATCAIGGRYLPAVLPALRRIVSSTYLMPLPLYGSGGRKLRILAVAAPSAWRSIPDRIKRFLSTLAEIPSGSAYSIGCENPSERTTLGPLISAL